MIKYTIKNNWSNTGLIVGLHHHIRETAGREKASEIIYVTIHSFKYIAATQCACALPVPGLLPPSPFNSCTAELHAHCTAWTPLGPRETVATKMVATLKY